MKMLLDLAPNEMVRKHLQEWNVPGGVPDEMFQLRTDDRTHWGLTAIWFGNYISTPVKMGNMIISGYRSW
jgi:hypothetical protein